MAHGRHAYLTLGTAAMMRQPLLRHSFLFRFCSLGFYDAGAAALIKSASLSLGSTELSSRSSLLTLIKVAVAREVEAVSWHSIGVSTSAHSVLSVPRETT